MPSGGFKTPGLYKQGKCLIPTCPNRMRAMGMCNKHYCKAYFDRTHRSHVQGSNLRRNVIAQDVSEYTGLSIQKSEKVVTNIFQVVTAALNRGEEVSIPGFGIFGRSEFSKNQVYFSPALELKKMVKLGVPNDVRN